jgi:hypothetical protein
MPQPATFGALRPARLGAIACGDTEIPAGVARDAQVKTPDAG